jgi:hypothetical protein
MHDHTHQHRLIGGHPSQAELIGHYITADGAAEVMAAVRENMRKGATQIKIATNGGDIFALRTTGHLWFYSRRNHCGC